MITADSHHSVFSLISQTLKCISFSVLLLSLVPFVSLPLATLHADLTEVERRATMLRPVI